MKYFYENVYKKLFGRNQAVCNILKTENFVAEWFHLNSKQGKIQKLANYLEKSLLTCLQKIFEVFSNDIGIVHCCVNG